MLFFAMTSVAFASLTYPAEVADVLEMPCEPQCTLCHATIAGGTGTVTQDFGQAMMARGLTGVNNVEALDAALQAIADDAVDSDDDGTVDVDELRAGQNPNPDGEDFCGALTPEFGCSSAGSAGGLWGALVVALGWLRRRHQRRQPNRRRA